MNQRGFAPIIFVVIVFAVLGIGAGGYVLISEKEFLAADYRETIIPIEPSFPDIVHPPEELEGLWMAKKYFVADIKNQNTFFERPLDRNVDITFVTGDIISISANKLCNNIEVASVDLWCLGKYQEIILRGDTIIFEIEKYDLPVTENGLRFQNGELVFYWLEGPDEKTRGKVVYEKVSSVPLPSDKSKQKETAKKDLPRPVAPATTKPSLEPPPKPSAVINPPRPTPTPIPTPTPNSEPKLSTTIDPPQPTPTPITTPIPDPEPIPSSSYSYKNSFREMPTGWPEWLLRERTENINDVQEMIQWSKNAGWSSMQNDTLPLLLQLGELYQITFVGTRKKSLDIYNNSLPVEIISLTALPGTDLIYNELSNIPEHLMRLLGGLKIYLSNQYGESRAWEIYDEENKRHKGIIVQTVPPDEITHEVGHILDFVSIRVDKSNNYTIGKTDEEVNLLREEFNKVFSVPDEPWEDPPYALPGYIYNYGRSNSLENFAIHFEQYISNAPHFRERAGNEPLLKEKYDFLKNKIFKGIEFCRPDGLNSLRVEQCIPSL